MYTVPDSAKDVDAQDDVYLKVNCHYRLCPP